MAGAAGGGGQGQNEERNSTGIIWLVVGIFFAGTVIWFAFGEQIKIIFIALRLFELKILSFVVQFLPLKSYHLEVDGALNMAKSLGPDTIGIEQAKYISLIVGIVYRWPFCLILGIFVYLIYYRNIKRRYVKKYDMYKLAEQEKFEWPQINPVLHADLIDTDIDSGPWAMSMTPINFCKYHHLHEIQLIPLSANEIRKERRFKAVINKTKTDQVFGRQLGRLWSGPEKLPIHMRAIFAAMIARGARQTKVAQDLIRQINLSATNDIAKKLDFSGADDIWKKYYNEKSVQKIIQAHAYEYTIFMDLFLYARQDGVFATSDFLWLKPRDRIFWYVLNSVGRQTPSCEAAGVFAHFLAEKSLGRPLSVPMVSEATKALQLALDELFYVPTDEEMEQILATTSNTG